MTKGESTPVTEIESQHATALSIVEDGISFARAKWDGEIPLTSKVRPIGRDDDKPTWSSRGIADVQPLQSLIRNGYNQKYTMGTSKTKSKRDKSPTSVNTPVNYWSPEHAAQDNVSINRPSHDAWGIPKIVLLFCDDFCQNLYELPWWGSTFSSAVQPILDVLDVPTDRVVRLILASLPPGVTIPVHHDSGEWVKYTHRIHVPILVNDPSRILFRCGKSNDSLEAIHCSVGHVFELNNQAKHAVSNCDSDHRVHLILDYVDRDFQKPPRIRLNPGEKLLQTRRSIDRLSRKAIRPTPSFLILGAQKAGTTFLYELLMQHALVVQPRRRETHCLDWRWKDDLASVDERRQWCHQFYYEKELRLHPSCLTGDSTPSYLIDSARVIPRLRQVFPWRIKFFVMCRNPVHRAESHYAMVTSPKGSPAQLKTRGSEWRSKSFDEVVWEDLMRMKVCGLLPYWALPDSLEANLDDPWGACCFDEGMFESFSGSTEELAAWKDYLEKYVPINTGSYGLLTRGLYELNLRPWLLEFDHEDFLVLRLEALSQQDTMETSLSSIWDHLGIPQVGSLEDTEPRNSREYESPMSTATRRFLDAFFRPHNESLYGLLKTKTNPSLAKEHWSIGWDCEAM